MSYCDRAVASDPGRLSSDSRGLANALLGRDAAAIADFEAFLAWVDSSPKDGCRNLYGREPGGVGRGAEGGRIAVRPRNPGRPAPEAGRGHFAAPC